MPADVRSCAAAAAVAAWVSAINPKSGVVVRGPAPGGLRAADVARSSAYRCWRRCVRSPVWPTRSSAAALRLRRRSPLAAAARRVLTVLAAASGGGRGMSASLIDRVRERLAAESAPLRPNVVAAAIRAESGGVLGDTEVLSSLRVLQTELTGAGILEPLLCADGTTDVLVTAPDAVWVDDGDGLRRSSVRFADEAAVRRLAQRLALSAGRRLDDAQPWVDGQLTGTGHRPVHRPAACGAPPDRGRWDVPVAAGIAACDTGSRRADADGHDRRRRPPNCSARSSPPGWRFSSPAGRVQERPRCWRLCWARSRADERIVCVEDAAELAPATSASGEARRTLRERRGRRRGNGPGTGQAGAADAAGPDRGR